MIKIRRGLNPGDFLRVDGSTSPTSDVDWGGYRIFNLGDPIDLKDAVNEQYLAKAVSAIGSRYYMLNTDSGIGNYKLCSSTPSTGGEQSLSVTDLTDGQEVGGWIAPNAGEPPKLIVGVYNWRVYAEKTAGTQTLRLYWKLIERRSDTSEVEIATSVISNEIVTGKNSYIIPLTLNADYEVAPDSYVACKVFAEVSGGGSAPAVSLYFEGNAASHFQIPANTEVLDSHYAHIDLGNVSDSNVLDKIKNVDGEGSGLDADTVDSFHASQSPQANTIPVLNPNGQLALPFVQTPVLVGGQDMMSRTFYVDAVNGDDNNDGSELAPFKTLQKAIDSVPVGGYEKIIVMGNYELEPNILIGGKKICLEPHGTLNFPWWVYDDTYVALSGMTLRYGSQLIILLDSNYIGKLSVNINTMGITDVVPFFKAAIRIDSQGDKNSANFIHFLLRVREDNYNPIVVNEGTLIAIREWSSDRPSFVGVSISGTGSGTNRSIKINTGAYLVDFQNSPGSLYYSYDGGLTDLNGTSTNIGNVIAGIVRDANDVPRNVISNKIL